MNRSNSAIAIARSDLRASLRVKMPGEVLAHDENQLAHVELLDMSAKGALVKGDMTFAVGDIIWLVVKSPALNAPLQTRGRIVRQGPKWLAIVFVDLDAAKGSEIETSVMILSERAKLRRSSAGARNSEVAHRALPTWMRRRIGIARLR